MAGLRIILNFIRESDAGLAEFAEKVGRSLKNNAFFAQPPIPLTALEEAIAELRAAVVAAKEHGTHRGALARHARREALEKMLRKLAEYVQEVCGDDLAVLASSGFELVVPRNRYRAEDVPRILTISQGPSSQLIVRVKAVAHAKGYEVRYSSAPDQWHLTGAATDPRRLVVANLKPGTTYKIQVRALGALRVDWSQPVSRTVV